MLSAMPQVSHFPVNIDTSWCSWPRWASWAFGAIDASSGSSHATPSCLSRTVGSGAQGCSGGSATGTAASASTGPKALPPGVVPWGSGPGQPTFSVTRRCVSRRNASPPRLHAVSCFAGLMGVCTAHLSKVCLELVGRRVMRLESRDTFLPSCLDLAIYPSTEQKCVMRPGVSSKRILGACQRLAGKLLTEPENG